LLAESRADVEAEIARSVADAKSAVKNYHDPTQICRKNDGMRLLREGTLPWGPESTSPPDGFDFEILDDIYVGLTNLTVAIDCEKMVIMVFQVL